MNAYDFDGTIYSGDSTVDFYLFLLKRHPAVLLALPKQAMAVVRYKLGRSDLTEMKEAFFFFLTKISDINSEVELFCKKNRHKIMPWYIERKKLDDLIISASPEFLLKPFCRGLGGLSLLASRVDPKSGKFSGANCKGHEKVRRFKEKYGDTPIEEFYSDSLSDLPMAYLAKKAFLVKNGRLNDWNTAEGK